MSELSAVARRFLPFILWNLLSREERRKFFVDGGQLKMIDAVTEFNHRRRARGGNPDDVQRDVDKICNFLDGIAGKGFVRKDKIKRGEQEFEEFHIYGSEYREHICAGEVFNECFGADNRKRINRISEILSSMEEWQLGRRLKRIDTAYPDQKKCYYRS